MAEVTDAAAPPPNAGTDAFEPPPNDGTDAATPPPISVDTPPISGDTPPIAGDTPPNAGNTPPGWILNDLPESILVHIISFLPTQDAIRTNNISRRWRNLWSTIPSLNFDYALFPPSPDSPDDTRRRFVDFVGQTLLSRSRLPPPLKFRFQFDFGDYNYWSQIESWIHYAVNHGVLELDVDFYVDQVYHGDPDEESCYVFNLFALANSRIRDLKIRWCLLVLPKGMDGSKFASIKSMYLSQIYLSDEMVSDLISVCVNLETLVLEDCYGMENLRICSKKLKNLSLWFFCGQNGDEGSVEICCPNLRKISIDCFKTGKYLIKQADSLVEARMAFFYSEDEFEYWNKVVRLFNGIRHLKVQNWWYKFFEQKDDSIKNFAFNKLRWLELDTGYTKHDLLGLARLLEICPNLHTMILGHIYKHPDEDDSSSEELTDEPINLNIPRLKQLKMKQFMATDGEHKILTLLRTQGPVLDKIVIVFPRIPQMAENNLPEFIVLRKRPPEQAEVNSSSTPISDVASG